MARRKGIGDVMMNVSSIIVDRKGLTNDTRYVRE